MKIKSEEVLFDTDGNRIQTHGGSIIKVGETFYWYGENKEGVTGKDENDHWQKWHSGIKYYSSKDLLSWKFEGYIKEQSDNAWDPFNPIFIMDRPHIIFNKKTNKFVCWVKSGYDIFCSTGFSILVGDSLSTMKYTGMIFHKEGNVGDFDLFEDDDGKAYIILAMKNFVNLVELNDEYTNFGEKTSKHLITTYPPYCREAPCYFTRNGRKFILTSGTTGYYPNRTIAYDITDLHGEWKELGYTCVDDVEHNSFHAQFSSVYKVPGKDLYIAIGDRWINDPNIKGVDFETLFANVYNPNRGPDWDEHVKKLNSVSRENTSEASYVWLPIKFDEKGNPFIIYEKEWELNIK